MSQRLDPSLIRHGRVNGRCFRENFAQGGIDLVQIVPELVTNADSAIAVSGRRSGRIVLSFGPPDPGFGRRVEAHDAAAARAGVAGVAARARPSRTHAQRHETQSLRHRAHEKLMRAFLDPEVFSGGVHVVDDEPAETQTSLTV